MEARAQMKKRDKYEIGLYASIYTAIIILLVVYQSKVNDFIDYGSEQAKTSVNIVSVIVSIIIAFRLKSIFVRKDKNSRSDP
jgi:hypothetical protein